MKRFTWESTPLINIMQWDTPNLRLHMLDECLAMHKALRPPVQSLKAKLGKQAFTWNGEFRFWVWEGADWRVFASNIHGISFEVREGLSMGDAAAAWLDFQQKVGLK